eukprot:scaffold746_cov123-Cylindrotheca_fusiformis.AAC.26
MVAPSRLRLEQEESSTFLVPADAKSMPRRRSVNFREKITVHRILNRRQLTKEEIKDCYMSASDFSRIRKDIKWLLKKEKEGSLDMEDLDHLRGLEAYVDQETMMKNARKKKHIIRSVISFPHSGVEGYDAASEIYHQLSKDTATLAHKRGLCDQQGNSAAAPVPAVMHRQYRPLKAGNTTKYSEERRQLHSGTQDRRASCSEWGLRFSKPSQIMTDGDVCSAA